MAKKKQPLAVMSKTETAREFQLTWDQVDYLFRKYQLRPVVVRFADRRAKWFLRSEVLRLMQVAPLKRAS